MTNYQNIFLSKAKSISENLIRTFIDKANENLESQNFPMDNIDLYKISYTDFNQVIEDFCDNVDLFLNPHQMSRYINELINKVDENIEDNIARNKEYYEEYLKQDFSIMDNELKSVEILVESNSINISNNTNIDKSINYREFIKLIKNSISLGFQRIIDIPNLSEQHKLSFTMIKAFVEENLIERFSTFVNKLVSTVSENNISFEDHFQKIKVVKDELSSEKIIKEEKLSQNKILLEENSKLVQEKEKIAKEISNTQIKNNHDLLLEKEKLIHKEKSYAKTLKEKDDKIMSLENTINQLTNEISNIQNEYNLKISELNKEITKLTINSEKQTTGVDSGKFSNSNQVISSFKSVKEVFSEFKETLDKLDKEKDSNFKFKILENTIKENENNYSTWRDDIKELKNEFSLRIEKSYENKLSSLREELNDIAFRLAKAEFSLNEEVEKNNLTKKQLEMYMNENVMQRNLLGDKDLLIESMNVSTSDLEKKSRSLELNIEDLELKLNHLKTIHNMNIDEVEYLILIIEDILVIFFILDEKFRKV